MLRGRRARCYVHEREVDVLPAPGENLIRDDAPRGLFFSRQGTWYEDGEAVTHAKLAALLSRCVARDAHGALIITTGRDVRTFTAEDAPLVGKALVGATLRLSNETDLPLADATLFIDDAGVLRTAAGAVWVVLSRAAAHDVGARLDDLGAAVVLADGTRARLVVDAAPRDWSAPPP
jgi:hypothetical protein